MVICEGHPKQRRVTMRPRRSCGHMLRLALLAVAALAASEVFAAELYHDGALDIRWDNTLRYTSAFRLFSPDPFLVENPNWDDGDRNFDPGLISNRLDGLSEFEVTDGDFGLRLSAAGWYDSVYRQRSDNDSPATFNPFSVPHDEFTRGVRRLHGADLQLDDAFVHGSFDIGGLPVSFRLGRYALLWGESLFFGENGIAAAQAPIDLIKELGEPSAYAKEIFLPVWQASTVLQLSENISLGAYYQFAWRGDQLVGSGTYFSYNDFEGVGGERIILAPGHFLYRARDITPPDTGQFGLSLQVSGDDFDYGFYALRFNARDPQTYAYFGAGNRGDGTYRLVYPTGIQLYGASFSTYVGEIPLAGEFSLRQNMPLVSNPVLVPAGFPADGDDHPLYAVGNTLHGQVSTVTTFGATPFWQRADLNFEVAANDVLTITKNPQAREPQTDRFAAGFHVTFEPAYFEVLPAVNLSVPLGFGYGLFGNSSVDETENARAGTLNFGIGATYRSVWQGSLTFTHFVGKNIHQPLADRDFISFSVQRTF